MNKELLIQLTKSYLHKNSPSVSNVYITIKEQNFDYTCINFYYFRHNVEIRIYSNTFIKFRVNDRTTRICSDINSIRKAIDDLQIYIWEY